MIRPATEALTDQPGDTAFVVGVLALAMVLPSGVMFTASAADRMLEHWTETYRPVVYLGGGTSPEAAKSLASDIREWSGVETCEIRTPKDAFDSTAERLGRDRLAAAGVKPEMFPHSLVVESKEGATAKELISKLKALEARSVVDRVDAPSSEVVAWGGTIRTVRATGLVLLLIFALAATAVAAKYLMQLRRRERSELLLLERFGAETSRLRRTTWIRGVVVGLWSGLISTGLLLAFALYSRTMQSSLLGGVTVTPRNWLYVVAPLLVGPIAGVAAGVWAARQSAGESDRSFPGLESLLDHG